MYFLFPLLLSCFLTHATLGVDLRDGLTNSFSNGEDGNTLHFTNEWGVEVEGGPEVADLVALQLGYRNLGQIGGLKNYYIFKRDEYPARHKRSASLHTRTLRSHKEIRWAEQQKEIQRFKRDYQDIPDPENSTIHFEDPDWPKQWYLHDTRQDNSEPKLDLNIVDVWKKNITGKGIVVTILDDGIEGNHSDLIKNYDPKASHDMNSKDSDPFPRYEETNENKHGTRCAGEVAMQANNDKCGVGVAYDAGIGGIRMLDGKVTDSLEAAALTHGLDHIDIYSASWGPNDDGKTVEGPGKLASKAFETGIREGRGGKGALYVWASGNGGLYGDNCDCDGYAGNIHTISISSASQHCMSPWYAEHCASTMATTYSSGTLNDQKIVSTDLHDKCTDAHTGTSASAPLAAGIFALVLQANPELTWRDVQHLIAWTSEASPFYQNPGWKTNGAGFKVNSRFGFGMLNAKALVDMAPDFKTVPEKVVCVVIDQPHNKRDTQLPRDLSSGKELLMNFETTGCKGQDNEVNYLEHVQMFLDLDYNKRGDLEAYLISPHGTNTMLLSKRTQDVSGAGFKDWGFMSVHSWGEDPGGIWKVKVIDNSKNQNLGKMKNARLVLHGTKEIPEHAKNGPRTYNENYNSVQSVRSPAEEILSVDGDPIDDENNIGIHYDTADSASERNDNVILDSYNRPPSHYSDVLDSFYSNDKNDPNADLVDVDSQPPNYFSKSSYLQNDAWGREVGLDTRAELEGDLPSGLDESDDIAAYIAKLLYDRASSDYSNRDTSSYVTDEDMEDRERDQAAFRRTFSYP